MQPAMTRASLLFCTALALALAACGEDEPHSDAGVLVPDAGTPDAAPQGTAWVVSSQTVNGTATGAATLDGAVVIGATDFAFATADPLGGLLTTYTLSGDGHSFVLAGGTTIPVTTTASELTFQPSTGRTIVAVPDRAAPAGTITVAGTVTAPTATPTYVHPKMLVAFLQRDEPGFVKSDTRNYQNLTFTGATATFALPINREALGTERIVYGAPNVGVAIAFVVVFDDRDDDGFLDDLTAPCNGAENDCIVGVSPLVLTFRAGTSPELTASPYAYTRDGGWSQSVIVTDARQGGTKNGLVSLDGGKVLPFDVTLWADPSNNTVPTLDISAPAKQ